jgi:PEP-CTERM motif
MKWFVLNSAACGLLLSGLAGAAPADLIVNGGFESSGPTPTSNFAPGWTNSDTANNFVVSDASALGYFPHSGNNFALMGTASVLSNISQTVTDTNGTSYILSLFYASNGATPNELKVQFGSNVLFDQSNLPSTGTSGNHTYVQLTFSVTGTGSDAVIISARDDTSFLALDDVSLNSIPEPSSLVLAAIAAAGFAGRGWRRWRSKAIAAPYQSPAP